METLPESESLCCVYLEDTMRQWELSVNRTVPRWAQCVVIFDGVTPWLCHSRLCSVTMRHMLRVCDHKDTGKPRSSSCPQD